MTVIQALRNGTTRATMTSVAPKTSTTTVKVVLNGQQEAFFTNQPKLKTAQTTLQATAFCWLACPVLLLLFVCFES